LGVRNIEASVRGYESIGFRASRKLTVSQLGARGQEIEAGEGTILLLQPEKSTDNVASLLSEGGAEGILGISIEVVSLQTARDVLKSHKTAI